MSFSLRSAAARDVADVLALATRFASNVGSVFAADASVVQAVLFGPAPKAHVVIAQDTTPGAAADRPAVVAFAVWHYDFDILRGSPGLYIDDLYVDAVARGQGIAIALFRLLARQAVGEGCAEIRWSARVGTASGLNLYQSLSAIPVGSWTSRRLAGEGLQALAG